MKFSQFRYVYVFRSDVHLSHEVRIETSVAAVVVCRCRIVFVNTVDLYILEGNFTCLVSCYKSFVERKWRRTGCKSEPEYSVVCLDRLYDLLCQTLACCFFVFKDVSRNPFESMLDAVWQSGLDEASVLW